MISVSLDNIGLSFGVDTVLEGITFSINEGDRLGIVGVNGAGKSTLIKIITGEYTPDSGSVYISKDKEVGVLEQGLGFESENTVLNEALASFGRLLEDEKKLEELRRETLGGDSAAIERYSVFHDRFTADGGYEFRGRCKGMLKHLGFGEEYFDLKISALSGGQKTRIALACLLLREPDILILDEPTNHLDSATLGWLEEFLSNYRKTIILISHDRYFLDRVTNKILEIENCRAKLYNGNYTRFVQLKAEDREIQERHYNNQQKEIARIEAYIEQQRRWNRERNIIAAESRQKMLDKMERVERPDALPDSIRLKFNEASESGNDVLTVKELSKSFPGKPLFSGLNFLLKKRERMFITGRNGCGKSTLIKIIAGKLSPDSGSMEYGYNVIPGYYDQENQQLDENNTVLDELWNKYDKLTQTEIRSALALFLFKGDDIEKKVSVLSGGEKARLTLAKLILSKLNLLILDEPTNHLDINSREALEKALLEFDGTVIAVSHDRYFVNKLATRILDIGTADGIPVDYMGGYEEYEQYKAVHAADVPAAAEREVGGSKEQYLKNKKEQAEKRREEKKRRDAEAEASKIETRIEQIDKEMNDAQYDHVKLAELYSEKENLETRLLELYEILD